MEAIRGLDEGGRRRLKRLAGRRLTSEGELVFRCGARRSQRQNRETCIDRLLSMVAKAAERPVKRRKTRPSRRAVERRLEEKKRVGEKKRRRGSGRSGGDRDW